MQNRCGLSHLCHFYQLPQNYQYNVTSKAILIIVMTHGDGLEQKSSLLSDLIKQCDNQVDRYFIQLALK